MNITRIIDRGEFTLFRHRLSVLVLFLIATVYLSFQASQIKLDASFTKTSH